MRKRSCSVFDHAEYREEEEEEADNFGESCIRARVDDEVDLVSIARAHRLAAFGLAEGRAVHKTNALMLPSRVDSSESTRGSVNPRSFDDG